MTVEIGAEAALFPEKENINGIFAAVWRGAGGAPDYPGYYDGVPDLAARHSKSDPICKSSL